MLHRILNVKKTFSAQKWDEEEQQRQIRLRSMASFPPEPGPVVRGTISGEGWGEVSARSSRPSTANTRRENAWNSNTDVNIRDSRALLGVKYQMPDLEPVRSKPIRPKTAGSLRRTRTQPVPSSEGGRARTRRSSHSTTAGGGGGGGGCGLENKTKLHTNTCGKSLGRNRPGYSNDPRDRGFDQQYRQLFATAREECQQEVARRTQKKVNNFMWSCIFLYFQ